VINPVASLADTATPQSHLVTAEVREQAVLALPSGGNLAGSLDFIPFVSAMTLGDTYPVSGVLRIPSARRADLEQLYKTGNPLWIFARESNVVTSTLYHRNPHDDMVITRPILGAVNLLV
jgi:hypothetical protein